MPYPANTRRWANAGLMLGQRRRLRPNINPTMVQHLVLTAMCAGNEWLQSIILLLALYTPCIWTVWNDVRARWPWQKPDWAGIRTSRPTAKSNSRCDNDSILQCIIGLNTKRNLPIRVISILPRRVSNLSQHPFSTNPFKQKYHKGPRF